MKQSLNQSLTCLVQTSEENALQQHTQRQATAEKPNALGGRPDTSRLTEDSLERQPSPTGRGAGSAAAHAHNWREPALIGALDRATLAHLAAASSSRHLLEQEPNCLGARTTRNAFAARDRI